MKRALFCSLTIGAEDYSAGIKGSIEAFLIIKIYLECRLFVAAGDLEERKTAFFAFC